MPAAKAPMPRGMPTMYASTTPGSTAWEMASPISDQPLRTRKQDSNAVGMATMTAISMAEVMKGNWNGERA